MICPLRYIYIYCTISIAHIQTLAEWYSNRNCGWRKTFPPEKRSLLSHLAQTQPVAGPVPPVEDERLCRLCFSRACVDLLKRWSWSTNVGILYVDLWYVGLLYQGHVAFAVHLHLDGQPPTSNLVRETFKTMMQKGGCSWVYRMHFLRDRDPVLSTTALQLILWPWIQQNWWVWKCAVFPRNCRCNGEDVTTLAGGGKCPILGTLNITFK